MKQAEEAMEIFLILKREKGTAERAGSRAGVKGRSGES